MITKEDKIDLFTERAKLVSTVNELIKFKKENAVYGSLGTYLLNAEYAQVLIEYIESKIVVIDNKLGL